MSKPKELHFFIDEEGFDPAPYITDPRERRLFGDFRTWREGSRWYSTYFDATVAVRGEATVAYTFPWYTGVPDRIAEVLGEPMLIYVVRDPVERAASHYHQFRAGGIEWRSVEEALGGPESVYTGPSRYATVLDRYLARFPRERIHIVRQEALLADRQTTLREVFAFLGVDEGYWTDEFERRRNRSDLKWRTEGSRLARVVRRLTGRTGASDAPAVSRELRAELVSRLEPEIAGLENLTGMDLAGWRAVD
jgi:hypothetical protein